MRGKFLRAKMATFLDRRSAKTTSPTLKQKLYRASRAVYPAGQLKRKVPFGEVFIPARQLSEEAQSAIKRIHENLEKQKIGKQFMVRGFPVGIAGVSLLIPAAFGNRNTGLFAWGMLTLLAYGSSPVIFLRRAAKAKDKIKLDVDFLSEHLQSISNNSIERLRVKYNFFYIGPKLNGVIMAALPKKIVDSLGVLRGGEIAVIDKLTGKTLYQGSEHRISLERRKSSRRSDKGKETYRW